MSVLKQISLKWIKYYGLRDISTNWIVTDFQKNRDFILQKVNDYQSYYDLLIEDFIFGFYLLNLFLLENDIKHNNSNYSWNLQIKNQYIDDINNIFKSLKLKEVNSATEIFRDYILNNIKLIISDDFKKQLLEHSASYSSILNIFLNHLLTNSSFFNTEEEVKTLILLIDKIPYFYPKFLKSNIKHKNLIVENFKKFIENKIRNQENLIPNMDLFDIYLSLIQNKKGEEGKQNIKLQEEITCYCKKQIDQIDDAFYKISSAENFINLVNKYGLKFRCTTNLSLWYKNLREQLFNSNQGNKSKFSYKLFNNEEEWEKYNEYINKTKDDIKNTGRKTWFYDSENQTAFSYKSETKNPWRDLFNNSTGTYGKSSQNIELSQSIKFQLFYHYLMMKKYLRFILIILKIF